MSILIEHAVTLLAILLALSLGLIGFLTARLRNALRSKKFVVDDLKREVKFREERIATLRTMRWTYRDIWDHLPAHLPMDAERASLAWTLGTNVVKIEPYVSGPRDPLTHYEWRPEYRVEIDHLVRGVNDPVLTALWDEGSFWSVHEMLRVLLFQCWDPSFNGHKGFGGTMNLYGKPWFEMVAKKPEPGGCDKTRAEH